MEYCIWQIHAPYMAHGGPQVGLYHHSRSFVTKTQMVGIIGNANQWSENRDPGLFQKLQGSLRYGCRIDRPGQPMEDFRSSSMSHRGAHDTGAWTTRGKPDTRAGDDASNWRNGTGNHKLGHYEMYSDRSVTVALTVDEDSPIALPEIRERLIRPKRSIFMGRKVCPLGMPERVEIVSGPSLNHVLRRFPVATQAPSGIQSGESPVEMWSECDPHADGAMPLTDRKDWSGQIHCGEIWMRRSWTYLG